MPLFFFDTEIGTFRSVDEVGVPFSDERAAIRVAFASLLDIVTDETDGTHETCVDVSIRDCAGAIIYRASLMSLPRTPDRAKEKPAPTKLIRVLDPGF